MVSIQSLYGLDPAQIMLALDHQSKYERAYVKWHNEIGHLLTTRPTEERYARFVAWSKRHHDN